MAQKRTNTKKTNTAKTASKQKPAYKKTTTAAKSSSTSRTNNNKKYISKPISSKSKPTTTKSKSNYYQNLYKNKYSKTNEVVINNKTYVLPKHDSFETYFCVWRMYSLIDPVSKKSFIRKFWIVIGKGHKSYRKFETQREAIRYFRNLKKYAKMKIQAINSKQFVKTIYTIFEMIYQGIDTNKIFNQKPTKNSKSYDESDYIDEYTQLDVLLNNDDTNENHQEIEEDIDKIINEKEGDTLVLNYKLDIDEDADKKTKEIQYEQIKREYEDTDDVTQENTTQTATNENENYINENIKTSSFKFYSGETEHLGNLDRQMDDTPILGQTQINYFDNINQIEYSSPTQINNTELIYTTEINENPAQHNYHQLAQNVNNSTPEISSSNQNNYSSGNTEIIIYKSDDTAEIDSNDLSKTSLYELITKDNKDFPDPKSNDLELEEELKEFDNDLNIIQHNTSLNKAIHNEKHKRNHKKNTILIATSSILAFLIIAAIVVVLLFVFNIIKI